MLTAEEIPLSQAMSLIVGGLLLAIGVYLLQKYMRQEKKMHETLLFSFAMFSVTFRWAFTFLWYTVTDPFLNQLVNMGITLSMLFGVFLLTTFFFHVFFYSENPRIFKLILAISLSCAIMLAFMFAFVFTQQPITGGIDFRYEYTEDALIILFLYLFPVMITAYVLFLGVSMWKFKGRIRTKSLMMGFGLLIWLFAEIAGSELLGIFAYIIYAGSLAIVLAGFLIKKD